MKINFWQILGGLLLIIGVIGVIYEKYVAAPAPASAPAVPAATQPATLPAAS